MKEKKQMSVDAANYPALKDVDSLEAKANHSMVLYDKEEYGQLVTNRFIENGLKKGENSICITHGEIRHVENDLEGYGIDVDLYKQRKQLHIFQIEDIMEDKDGLEKSFNKFIKKVTADLKPPYRFTGRIIPDVTTKQGIEAELILEHRYHSNFDKYQSSFLCAYPVSAIEETNRPNWITHLMENHHHLIYATEPRNAVTFDPDLLS
jgi:hypothetical protein